MKINENVAVRIKMKKLKFEMKSVYGRLLFAAKTPAALKLCQMVDSRRTTLNRDQIEKLRDIGVPLTIVKLKAAKK